MYTFLILFFLSLLGIIIMLARKMALIKNGVLVESSREFLIKIPNLHEVKYVVVKSSRKYGFITLVIMLRAYVLSVHLVKKTYKKSKVKIKEIHKKYLPHKHKKDIPETKEPSGFLKAVSEYKQKVKKIKHKIKEEEGIE